MDIKVLVPLDGSKLSEIVLPYAEALAGRLGAEIILLFVDDSAKGRYKDLFTSYLEKMAELVKEGARKFLSAETAGHPPIDVKPVMLSGYPAEKIAEYADKNDVACIVMAAHGQSGIRQWALGSVAEKVVRATYKPVLLIRTNGVVSRIHERQTTNKVLVPLDGSAQSEAIIPFMEEFASRLHLQITLLEVLPRGYYIPNRGYVPLSEEQLQTDKQSVSAYLEKIAVRLREKGISAMSEEKFGFEVKFGNAAEQIIKLADAMQVELVAMTTHGRSSIGRTVFGSIAEKVLLGGNTPLLLVRPPKASRESTGH